MKQKTKNIFLLILLFSSFWILMPLTSDNFEFNDFWVKRSIRMFIAISLVIVVNIKYLMPRFYFQGQKGIYVLLSFLLVIGVTGLFEMIIDPFFEIARGNKLPKKNSTHSMPRSNFFKGLIPFILALIGSSFSEVSNFANEKIKEALTLKSEKTEAEMKLLKSQINPHFLFNALNNVYSLSYLKPEKTPENLLKLSQLLRYMLYECNDERVPLSKEIVSLENFIDLNLLKNSKGMQVTVDMEKPSEELMIAPLLLMPFVENAFKHSKVEDLEKGWINIQLQTKDKKIVFRTENSIPTTEYTKDSVGGIGLANVKRRLELIYPKKNKLEISTENNRYAVRLEIDLA